MKKIILILICLVNVSAMYGQQATGEKVSYDLYVKDTTVNYTGKPRHAIAINGQIPGPTIELTQGDTAVIRIHNLMHVMTSIHWHGILIPNRYDGVPGLTNLPIKPDSTLTVVFPVRQNGTYWYHSHTMTQEQIGLTGSIVIHKRDEPKMKEQVLVLNDWTDIKPSEVLRLLKRNTDYFSIQKKSVQSYGEAIAAGHLADKLKQEWIRMPAMDISDVKYNRFLINGTPKFENENYKSGDSIKLRIVNASSSSYFWIQFAGGRMKVVAADGQDVQPVDVDKFLIATAETYDVIIRLPATGKYELRATAQDISGYASAYLGNGREIKAPEIPKINYFRIMSHMNNMMHSMNMMMGVSKGPATNIELKNHMDKMDMKGMNMDHKKDASSMPGMDMGHMNMDHKKDTSSMPGMDMGNM
ncbi:MAG TPA: multicopper oxidase domain-containing protein, partial [Hanamia sp.]|nr:multicopper oxidase domain-containing protein [Hanamia sp.]